MGDPEATCEEIVKTQFQETHKIHKIFQAKNNRRHIHRLPNGLERHPETRIAFQGT